MKGKDLHPRLLYPAKLSFRMEGQIKCFPDKVPLGHFQKYQHPDHMGARVEEEEQEIENLFEKIMKENLPNLVKEIDIKSRKGRVPNKLDPKRTTPRHIIIKIPKVKDKERI